MIIHATMKLKRKAARCPTLAGQTFDVFDGMTTPVLSGTVKIEDDLSYTVNIGGNTQSGQLTQVTPREYKYHENGPPVIDGTLTCIMGRWYFQDSTPGTTAAGSIAL